MMFRRFADGFAFNGRADGFAYGSADFGFYFDRSADGGSRNGFHFDNGNAFSGRRANGFAHAAEAFFFADGLYFFFANGFAFYAHAYGRANGFYDFFFADGFAFHAFACGFANGSAGSAFAYLLGDGVVTGEFSVDYPIVVVAFCEGFGSFDGAFFCAAGDFIFEFAGFHDNGFFRAGFYAYFTNDFRAFCENDRNGFRGFVFNE
jgi:hypothetical protein